MDNDKLITRSTKQNVLYPKSKETECDGASGWREFHDIEPRYENLKYCKVCWDRTWMYYAYQIIKINTNARNVE